MKIAVYTSLYGKKDILRPPLDYVKDTNIDYYIFTDSASVNIEPYKTVIRPAKFTDIAKNARYFKILGDDLLKHYNILIWHDANIQLKYNAIDGLVEHARNTFLTVFTHPHRNCFYSEAMTCIRGDKDFSLRILRQSLAYFLNGMPAAQGMYPTGIIVKNFKYKKDDNLLFWWQETLKHSRRDQLSLAFTIYCKKLNIHVIQDDIFNNRYSIYRKHIYEEYRERKNIMNYNYPLLKKLSILVIQVLRKIKKAQK